MDKSNFSDFYGLDEVVTNSSSFRNIMEDGVVTDQEVESQAQKVLSIAGKLDEICSEEEKDLINQLMAEIGVLYMVYNANELQSVK